MRGLARGIRKSGVMGRAAPKESYAISTLERYEYFVKAGASHGVVAEGLPLLLGGGTDLDGRGVGEQ